MLILCSTNRALECLHVQSHILLSISYRIITHSVAGFLGVPTAGWRSAPAYSQ